MSDSEKLDLILSDMQGMKDDMQGMKDDMQGMKNEIHDLKDDMQEVKQKVSKIDMTLENEIRVNIQRVAEGHLDLSRNLHEAMRPGSEVEMLAIKVRMLETDVKELKEKIS